MKKIRYSIIDINNRHDQTKPLVSGDNYGFQNYLAYTYSERRLGHIVDKNGLLLKHIIFQSEQMCLAGVKQNGSALEYVKNQTEQMCLEAVKQYGPVLYYVKNQTEQMCIEAVRQNGYILKSVKTQTLYICIEAVKKNNIVLEVVDDEFKEEVEKFLRSKIKREKIRFFLYSTFIVLISFWCYNILNK